MKKIISFILTFILVFTNAYAYSDNECADALYSLGLFLGTDNGYELENAATRVQVAVTVTRLLGKESKAKLQENEHPFSDVPKWASPYVGYLYENYLINGVSDTWFGSDDTASVKQFAAMLLRILGYSDAKGDFEYENAVSFAASIGLFSQDEAKTYKSTELGRGVMVQLAYRALSTELKNSRRLLSEKLCDERVFSEEKGLSAGVMDYFDTADIFAGIPENPASMNAVRSGSNIILTLSEPVETYGLRLYYAKDGENYREANGAVSFELDDISYKGAGTYAKKLLVYGLGKDKYSFILVKTTSTSNIYSYVSKTNIATLR